MFDGYNFIGAKAYKDSKLCLMMFSNMLHDRYYRQTGISFSSIYPGCIAESPLFREKRPWFRKYFPIFMKYITGGFVGEEEAGMRLFQVAHDPRCTKSGVYWSWNGGPREGRGAEALDNDGQILGGGGAGGGWDSIYENDQSDKVLDKEVSQDLWKYSTIVTGAEWPPAYQPKSPCPTLKVVGAVTDMINRKEEMKRMKPMPGMVGGLSTTVVGGTAQVADKVVGSTLGTVVRKAQSTLLGSLPENAVEGSFQADKAKADGEVTEKRGFLRRVFRRGRKEAGGEEEAVLEIAEVPVEETVGETGDEELVKKLDERLQVVLWEDKASLEEARASLEACLKLDECNLDDEYSKLAPVA
jgi:hypothetical protein